MTEEESWGSRVQENPPEDREGNGGVDTGDDDGSQL